jgi:hypothetical protein
VAALNDVDDYTDITNVTVPDTAGWTSTTATTALADNPGTGINTVDISASVQEVVNRASWVSGQGMGVAAEETGGTAGNYISVDPNTNPGVLTINYLEAGGSLPPTRRASRRFTRIR